MGTLLRWLFPILLVGVVGYVLAVYAEWLVIYIVLGTYGLVALLWTIGIATVASSFGAPNNHLQSLNLRAKKLRDNRTLKGRAGALLAGLSLLFQALSQGLIWPVSLVLSRLASLALGLGTPETQAEKLKTTLRPLEVVAAIGFAVFALLPTALFFVFGITDYLRIFAVISLSAIVFHLIGLTISPISFVRALRLKSRVPYLLFILCAAFDALALVLSLHNLRAAYAMVETADYWPAIVGSAKMLFDAPSFISVIIPPRMIDPFVLLAGILGLLFYSVLASNALRLKEFFRTDEDWIQLASFSLVLGRPYEAIRRVERIRDRSRSKAQIHSIRSVALAALHQFDDAFANAQNLVTTEDGLRNSPELALGVLASGLINASTSAETKLEFLRYAAGHAVGARQMMSLAEGFFMASREESIKIARGIVADPALSEVPLLKALAVLILGDRDEALQTLAAYSANNPQDQLQRDLIALLAELIDPATSEEEDKAHFEQWVAAHLGVISELIAESSEVPDLFFLIGLHRSLNHYADALESRWRDTLRYQLDLLFGKVMSKTEPGSEISDVLAALQVTP